MPGGLVRHELHGVAEPAAAAAAAAVTIATITAESDVAAATTAPARDRLCCQRP